LLLIILLSPAASEASYVTINVNSRKKRNSPEDEAAVIDKDGVRRKNPMEKNEPDGETVAQFVPQFKSLQHDDGTEEPDKNVENSGILLDAKDQKVVTLMTRNQIDEQQNVEEILSVPSEKNMQSLLQSYTITNSADSIERIHGDSKDEHHQKVTGPSKSEELEITIADDKNSMNFQLYPNQDLFSDDFKVIVRDTVKKNTETDGGQYDESENDERENVDVVEVEQKETLRNCIFVGKSKDDPEIQVALTNCNGEGFVSIVAQIQDSILFANS